MARVALTLDEYLFDTQAIARGIVVGNAIDRSVLEANALEFFRRFVLLQYFGYLRRDPDLGGYNFWLNKLDAASTSTPINSANVSNDPEALGRASRAQMIESFIRSCEYQRRFGVPTTSPNDQPVSTQCGA